VVLGPDLAPAGIVEIVVADDAQVRNRQSRDLLEIALVALGRPGPGEVAEVGEKSGAGCRRAVCSSNWAKIAAAVGSGQAPLSPVITNENG
jgi:hypothetical protein